MPSRGSSGEWWRVSRELGVTASFGAEPAEGLAARLRAVREQRAERGDLAPGAPAARSTAQRGMAVVAEQPDDALPQALALAGWDVVGVAATDAFEALLWASRVPSARRSYVELPELLLDPDVHALCLALGPQELGAALPAAVTAGLHILLPTPVELGSAVLRRLLGPLETHALESVVGFRAAGHPVAAAVGEAISAGEIAQPLQITVRRWPTGPGSVAELVELVRSWCGEPLAACAHPPQLPAQQLPDGTPVRWALLSDIGTTVLVGRSSAANTPNRVSGASPASGASRAAADPADLSALLRLSGPGGWLDVSLPVGDPPPVPDGGAAVPDLGGPAARATFPDGSELAVRHPLAQPSLVRAARELAERIQLSGWAGTSGGLSRLFLAERVREALAISLRDGRWVEL